MSASSTRSRRLVGVTSAVLAAALTACASAPSSGDDALPAPVTPEPTTVADASTNASPQSTAPAARTAPDSGTTPVARAKGTSTKVSVDPASDDAPVDGKRRTWRGLSVFVPDGWSAGDNTDSIDGNEPGAQALAVSSGNRDDGGVQIVKSTKKRLDPKREAGGLHFYDGPCGVGENYRRIRSVPVTVDGERGTYAEFGCSFGDRQEEVTAVQYVFPDQGVLFLMVDRPGELEHRVVKNTRF